jgi:choline dehydrogenase-like flavoprotein
VTDVLVVGGGSAGCVIAARLSEDPSCQVLLLEGGPDAATLAELPRDVVDASEPTEGHDWGYKSEPDALGRSVSLPRARFIGGCSSTNGCFALRGAPADYDGWAQLGNAGWSFDEILPFFRRLENDADFADDWHGVDGPLPIRRHPPSELNAVQLAFIDAAKSSGIAYVEDHNRPGALGVGPTPRNARDGVRMSTALTYLAAARGRPNLTIRGDAIVDRVVLDGARATGARLIDGEVIDAGRVVLAAGAYATPAILQRSGVGPAALLAALDIRVVVDLPGVGENLVDHPLCAVDLPTTADAVGAKFQAIASLRSQRAPDGAPDLHVFAAGPFNVPTTFSPTGRVFGLVAGLVLPRSRGWVRLRSVDPMDPPRIDVAHLCDADDTARMVEATLVARRISRTSPLAELIAGDELSPGPSVNDDDLGGIAESVRSRVASYHHPVGTCRMGTDPDAGAVVDPRGRVYGIEQLDVADASIMPTIPSANTNLPTIMVAERMSAWLRQG